MPQTLQPGEILRVDYEVGDRCQHCNQGILFADAVGKWFAQDQRSPRNVFLCAKAPRGGNGFVATPEPPRHEPAIITEVDRGMMT